MAVSQGWSGWHARRFDWNEEKSFQTGIVGAQRPPDDPGIEHAVSGRGVRLNGIIIWKPSFFEPQSAMDERKNFATQLIRAGLSGH
jgi:hypothetical protein